ncbi:MAG TPA: aminopeptidase, partial [Actinomycetes bacterium]|nr:aminopeptidase [Actinomycetes bacterium]
MVVVVGLALAVAAPAGAATQVDTSALRSAVTVAGIEEHQQVLEDIAFDNVFNGVPTRATGTPG